MTKLLIFYFILSNFRALKNVCAETQQKAETDLKLYKNISI